MLINICADGAEEDTRMARFTAEIFRAKLQGAGISVRGIGGTRKVPSQLPLFHSHKSSKTLAEISSDLNDPTVVGNTPRHQANFIFSLTPQYETELFTLGANLVGTTSSFAQDTNQLKLPGYTTVNAFLQLRPLERVELGLNVNNVFDVLGLAEVTQAAIPATGIVTARAINGRTVQASVRYSF